MTDASDCGRKIVTGRKERRRNKRRRKWRRREGGRDSVLHKLEMGEPSSKEAGALLEHSVLCT